MQCFGRGGFGSSACCGWSGAARKPFHATGSQPVPRCKSLSGKSPLQPGSGAFAAFRCEKRTCSRTSPCNRHKFGCYTYSAEEESRTQRSNLLTLLVRSTNFLLTTRNHSMKGVL